MEHPELLQAYRSRRPKVKIIQIIVSVILAIVITMLAASATHAETYKELQDRYQKVEVGIAPGEYESNVRIIETEASNTSNALKSLEIVENPYQTISISDSEYEELRWILALEAQGEGLNGEIAVLETIFNRVLSQKNWGGSVHGVLSKRGQFSTYCLIGSSRAWAKPGELEDDAISECLRRGPSILPDMKYVYFDTGRKNGSRNIKIGHHWFGAEK